MKEYVIMVLNKKSKINVKVKAKDEREAINKIEKLLINCNFFGYVSLNDFNLKCIKN